MNILRRGINRRPRIAAVGMYDGVHLGHRFLIDFLRAEAHDRGLAPTLVTFSAHPRAVVNPERAPRVLSSLEERIDSLDACGIDDCIILDFTPRLQQLSAREFLATLRDDYGVEALVMGYNNHFGSQHPDAFEAYQQLGDSLGVAIIAAPEYRAKGNRKVSSSIIRALLAEGLVEDANAALGHPYTISGTVVHGRNVGHTIGFPTANVRPNEPNLMLPAVGVYAAYAVTPDGQRRKAIVNIGPRPTFDVAEPDATPHSIEAHILDYSGYLYDETIRLELHRRLRDQQRFDSPERLAAQLKRDARDARHILAKPTEHASC